MFNLIINFFKRLLFNSDDAIEKSEREQTVTTSQYEVPINKNIHDYGHDIRIKSVDPRSYFECTTRVNDYLKSNNAVIINFHRLDKDSSAAAVAYLSGAVYALNGTIEKIGDNVILIASNGISVSGSLYREGNTAGGKHENTNDK